jgi:hypothetical protein
MREKYPNVHWVIYVDDIVIYSNSDTEFEAFVAEFPKFCNETYGFIVSESKSTISKRAGVWVNPSLKFLGTVYDTDTGLLYSKTRSGRSMAYSFKALVDFGVFLGDEKALESSRA